ncbi:MAG TPA: hypothetical protein VFC31_14080 [Candidatus Limnocylindria bacterium]|nr:hypothetical protein [Candidatus Limnocylindria bacterium]
MRTVAAARPVSTILWIGLAAFATALLVWWAELISRGPAHVGAWMPFVLPIIFVVRAALRTSWASALPGLALGITFSGVTGRGVVFAALALAGVLIDLAITPESSRRASLVWSVAGIGLGLIALVAGLSLEPTP